MGGNTNPSLLAVLSPFFPRLWKAIQKWCKCKGFWNEDEDFAEKEFEFERCEDFNQKYSKKRSLNKRYSIQIDNSKEAKSKEGKEV